MAGLSDYSAGNVLAYLVGKTAMPALPSTFVALFTTAPTSDAGTGGTEVSGGSYARKSTAGTDWNTPTASAGNPEPTTTPELISNVNTITFVTATANWGTVQAFGVYDASSAGNLLFWDYLGNWPWLPATMTSVASGNGGVVTSTAHGYANGDTVVVTQKYGGTLPTVSQGSFNPTLLVANSTTDTFTLTTSGAVNIWTTSTGDFQIRKVSPQLIPSGVQASFAGGSPGALVVTMA